MVGLEKHEHVGTCQEIVQNTKMELNPNYLTKCLKQNKPYLDENHILSGNLQGRFYKAESDLDKKVF